MKTEEMIKEILDTFGGFSVNDVPDIDLYMDQVTTLLNNKFAPFKRTEDDKLLTKTMINNYTKFKLLPAPEKKKYSKDHIIILIMIYFFKNMISINDTGTLISPAVDEFFHNEEHPLDSVYGEFVRGIKIMNDDEEILRLYKECTKLYNFDEYENSEYLKTLSYIAILCYQAYVRQQLVLKLIDGLPDELNIKKDENK